MLLGIYSQLVDTVFTMVSWLIPVLLLIGSFKLLFLSNLKGIEGERQVQKQLKKLDLEAMHDVILPDGKGGLTQIDHIVLLSDKILVIETKNYSGLLFGNVSDLIWTHKIGRRTHRLQNPLRQNKLHIKAVQALKPGVPVSGLVIFTNHSKFPNGIPNGVIQLKDLKKYLGHNTCFETKKTLKDAWRILKLNVRTDKTSKKEHMAQIEKKYGKDKKRYAAYLFLSISIIWLLGNLISSNHSATNLSYENTPGDSVKDSLKNFDKNFQQQPIKDYMIFQRDRYIEKMQNNVSDSSRCVIYKTRFKETGQSHKSSAAGAFTMDMTNLWGEVKKAGCSKNKINNISNKQSQPINIFSATSNYIQDEIKSIRNATPVYKKINYKGYQVTYTYQFWKINYQSICNNYRNKLSEYSNCTQAAKRLFFDICTGLKRTQNSGINKQQEIMYCDNSRRYKPTIATIIWSDSTDKSSNPNLEAARDKCNSLITKALISRNEFDVERRDEACKKYRIIKNNN